MISGTRPSRPWKTPETPPPSNSPRLSARAQILTASYPPAMEIPWNSRSKWRCSWENHWKNQSMKIFGEFFRHVWIPGPVFFWETATGDCFTLHVVGPSRFSLALHGTNVDTHRLRIIRIEQIMGWWLWFLLSRDLPIFTLYCYIVMFIVYTDTLHIWSYMHTVYVRFRQDYYT